MCTLSVCIKKCLFLYYVRKFLDFVKFLMHDILKVFMHETFELRI